MEKLLEILEDIQPDADYATCETLIDDGILDSFAILSIVRMNSGLRLPRQILFQRILIQRRHCMQW